MLPDTCMAAARCCAVLCNPHHRPFGCYQDRVYTTSYKLHHTSTGPQNKPWIQTTNADLVPFSGYSLTTEEHTTMQEETGKEVSIQPRDIAPTISTLDYRAVDHDTNCLLYLPHSIHSHGCHSTAGRGSGEWRSIHTVFRITNAVLIPQASIEGARIVERGTPRCRFEFPHHQQRDRHHHHFGMGWSGMMPR